MPTYPEQKRAAEKFTREWLNRTGYEKGETSIFWIQLLREVFGVPDAEKHIVFEDRVQIEHTNFIDARIPSSRVLIEQKGADVDLAAKQKQSDGALLTPLQQAQRYVLGLPLSAHPRYIIVCNFLNFQIHDCETRETTLLPLADLPKNFTRLAFLIDLQAQRIARETEISKTAGQLIGELYDELIKRYENPQSPETLAALNVLCVRLAFCLYAEDAGIFGKQNMFENYIRSLEPRQIRRALAELFKILDTPVPARDKYLADDDPALAAFPYANGGLFAQPAEIPPFDEAAKQTLLRAANFDWSEISPTIFGAIFESTLNPVTRRTGGMHYTSIQNIHKVIDPLFLNELRAEFEKLKRVPATKLRGNALREFQNKIAALKFLDPACGSGNFLTESFISLRRLENEIIAEIHGNETQFSFVADELIKVSIHQFYGIEINDFAVTVAKTALWIAESQMLTETEKIIDRDISFLPLKSYANIAEGNALRLDWATLKVSRNLGEFNFDVPANENPVPAPVQYDFIMGNPPFSGARVMTAENKADLLHVFGKDWKNAGNLDFVSAWFKKAHELIAGTPTRAALVATNSICQGESVANLWKPLFENGFQIDFAYRTFRWDSESDLMAHVHCVIIGFSCGNDNSRERLIFIDGEENPVPAKNINPYLIDSPSVFIEKRSRPICDVPAINKGSQPTDGGNLIIEADEIDEFLKAEPFAEKWIRPFLGSEEFINGKKRYCLWLVGANPAELRKCPRVMKRIEAVREMRLASKKTATKKLAGTPTLFTEIRQPEAGNYIIIPRVSSERRNYVPMGFVPANIIASDAVQIIPNAELFHFGVLTSRIHMAWMRAVCGRLKSDYRYSNSIVYNNFIWPNVDERSRERIEKTAQAILDARALFPNCSLADLYDANSLLPELRRAHELNDRAVAAAYAFPPNLPEPEIVARLFALLPH